MIATTRILSQQLSQPRFDNPKDLVSWMGAIQAQDYNMMKWAVGIRMKNPSLNSVKNTLERGEILRTHVMRPTWHLVAAEDIRWMVSLSQKRLRSIYLSFRKRAGIDDKLHSQYINFIVRMLEGSNGLTKEEIGTRLEREGIPLAGIQVSDLVTYGEIEGIICSGIDKGNKITYALLEERAAPIKELHREEALARLATKYFQSHTPATLNDFVWWSGLTITEARHAIKLIEGELNKEKYGEQEFYMDTQHNLVTKTEEDILHLLPSYDEFLISYKDRSASLKPEHRPKAFNNYGIFHPVVMYNGKIAANWKKQVKKGETSIETLFFEKNIRIPKALLKAAELRFKTFITT